MTEEPAPYFTNYGDMIRHIRKEKRITIVELAERMGVSQAYIVGLSGARFSPQRNRRKR